MIWTGIRTLHAREAADDLRTWEGNTVPRGRARLPDVLENFLRAHERHIDISVVTNAAHYLKGKRAMKNSSRCQAWDRLRPQRCSDHKGKLYSFAPSLPCRGPAVYQGNRRAIKQLGLKGIFITQATRVSIPTTTRRGRSGAGGQDLDVR